jgi:hypothetical protein
MPHTHSHEDGHHHNHSHDIHTRSAIAALALRAALLIYQFSPVGCPGDDIWAALAATIPQVPGGTHIVDVREAVLPTTTGIVTEIDGVQVPFEPEPEGE